MCHLVVPARMLGLLCIFKSIFTSNIYRAFKWWYFDDALQMQRSLEFPNEFPLNNNLIIFDDKFVIVLTDGICNRLSVQNPMEGFETWWDSFIEIAKLVMKTWLLHSHFSCNFHILLLWTKDDFQYQKKSCPTTECGVI